MAIPGHVAQMQKLFQTAKASLRLDVRFAASPVGSIDSRLPDLEDKSNGGRSISTSPKEPSPSASDTPSRWRYSTAPRVLAEFDIDVREPIPEGSPQLPDLMSISVDQSKVLVAEPLSSGFTSPTAKVQLDSYSEEMKSSPLHIETRATDTATDDSTDLSLLHAAQSAPAEDTIEALHQPLADLKVSSDNEMDMDSLDDSPITTHLKKRSSDASKSHSWSPVDARSSITLSETAKAAAASARVKRGMLTDLFPKPPTHKSSSACGISSEPPNCSKPSKSRPNACPDPALHERTPIIVCPEPALHFRAYTPNLQHGVIPEHHSHIYPGGPGGMRGYPGHYNRATATGSPMPFKVKSSATLPNDMRRQSHESLRHTSHMHHVRSYRQPHDLATRPHTSSANEHFQPGWYYANQDPRLSKPGMYSFSTAAAMSVGQDPAPDSMIRDSYRTDTLTPLARPPSRFRKNGIIALANSRGVGKYYGGSIYDQRAPFRQKHSSGYRGPDAVRFRSSPPGSPSDCGHSGQPRKRTRDSANQPIEILEDNEDEGEEKMDPKSQLEEGDEVIQVDEETRAAVRMSLFGTSSAGSSMKELSANVMTFRRGAPDAGSRKKRRPSYWDGDLKEIMRSPAARHVVSSPTRKDDVRSQQAEVEFDDGRGVDEASLFAEGPTAMQEDIQMHD